jgi:hypothetical protein
MMSDADRMLHDEDRLPWLEPVENEDQRGGGAGVPPALGGAGAVVAALVAALVALGLVVGGIFWLRDGGVSGGGGSGELIAAPAGPYKQKPAEPGGMKVEGQGDAAFAASAGTDVNAAIDISAIPEAPLAGTRSAGGTPAPPPVEAAPVAAAAPVTAGSAAAAPASGGLIQLGAFSSEAKANLAWKTMATRFAYLKPLASSVTPVASGSNTLYRLRASAGADAGTVCGKLKVAGESCTVLGN